MRILIDGYNLLHASTIVPTADNQGTLQQTRAALLDYLIAALPVELSRQTTIVFDKGTERGLSVKSMHGPLTVLFALKHAEADDLIELLIGRHHAPRNLTVVSSDHRVQRAARRRRARPVDSDVWLNELARLRAAQRQPSRDEAEVQPDQEANWLAAFADVDVAAIEREVEQECSTALPPTPSPVETDPEQAEPGDGLRQDDLDAEQLDRRRQAGPPLFPEGYGDDLLEES